MRSMTGFGQGRVQLGGGTVLVQIAAVNGRAAARVQLRGDLRDLALEERLRARVQKALVRGSATLQIGIEGAGGPGGLDPEALRSLYREFAALAAELGAPPPRLEEVATQLPRRAGLDPAQLGPAVAEALDLALAELETMRRNEGARLRQALETLRGELLSLCQQIAAAAGGRAERQLAALRTRVDSLLAGRATCDEAALARELGILADRLDVREELDRLDSHLAQLQGLLSEDGEVGRRLEFLLQEIGRELNTCGSKANHAPLQQLVIQGKNLVEQLKEQVANLL